MENQEAKEVAEEKPAATKGLGSFKGRRAPDPERVNSEVNENVAYLKSFIRSAGNDETKPEMPQPAKAKQAEADRAYIKDRVAMPDEDVNASPKAAPAKLRRGVFASDGTSFAFSWESRLQSDWETLQLTWKKANLRASSREFMIVAMAKALQMTKEEYEAAYDEALRKYGTAG